MVSDLSLCPHLVEGAGELWGVSFIRTLIPFMSILPSWFKISHSISVLISHWALRFQHMNWGGRGHKRSGHSKVVLLSCLVTLCLIFWETIFCNACTILYILQYSSWGLQFLYLLLCCPWQKLSWSKTVYLFFIFAFLFKVQLEIPGIIFKWMKSWI